MQVARRQRPDIAEVIADLELNPVNIDGVLVCKHRGNPCISRCCVRTDESGRWVAIPEAERQAWFDRVLSRKN